jgi:hypothetical protein
LRKPLHDRAWAPEATLAPSPAKSKCIIIVKIQIVMLGQMLNHLRVHAGFAFATRELFLPVGHLWSDRNGRLTACLAVYM